MELIPGIAQLIVFTLLEIPCASAITIVFMSSNHAVPVASCINSSRGNHPTLLQRFDHHVNRFAQILAAGVDSQFSLFRCFIGA